MKVWFLLPTSVLLVGMGSAALANPPQCIDRPTPPPCCADGHCISSPMTYGVYATRWRRWPLDYAGQLPTDQVAAPLQQGTTEIPSFVTPNAELEDQKAPPPSTPRAEEPGVRMPPEGGGGEPGGRGATGQPPITPLAPPSESGEPSGIMRRLPEYQPKAPAPKGLDSLGPQSDLDPPPALPFGPQPVRLTQPVREALQVPAKPIRQPAPAKVSPPSDDPPPSLPTALAQLSN